MAEERDRVVLDTNLILSSLLAPGGAAGTAVAAAFENHEIVASPETLGELKEKLASKKLAAFIDSDIAQLAFQAFSNSVTMVEAAHNVEACRDPKDNKFLDLAIEARATRIVSGDRDLLTLKELHGIGYYIPIITPARYVAEMGADGSRPQQPSNEYSTLMTSMRDKPGRTRY